MRRLSRVEYVHSVEQLFGLASGSLSQHIPALPTTALKGAFEVEGDAQQITPDATGSFYDVAEQIVSNIMKDAAIKSAIATCDITQESCATEIIQRLGRLAFRHKLSSEEATDLKQLVQSQASADDALSLLLEALITSPSFLYRVESGTVASGKSSLLNGYEMATRLSLLLTGTIPSNELLNAAEQGALDSTAGVRNEAQKLIDSGKAQAALEPWLEQWFELAKTSNLNISSDDVAGYTPELAADMRGELLQMLNAHLWGETNFMDFYQTKTHYVNSRLASIYGLQNISGADLQAHTFDSDPNRGGFFTTAGFSMITSKSANTSLIHRGLFVRLQLLCNEIPTPTVFPTGEAADTATRSNNPECAGCHNQIDPIGAGLERYDVIGNVRATYPSDNKPVPMTGTVAGIENSTFEGGVGLGAVMAKSEQARHCAIEQMTRWFLGRRFSANEASIASAYDTQFLASQGRFKQFILDFVQSDTFRSYVRE